MDCIRPLIYPPYPPTPLHCESASTSSSMASITAMWTTTAIPISYKPKSPPPSLSAGEGRGGLTVVCSSRPQKKSTAHHMKTRPKKSQPWDIKRRGPTPYPPLPSLPPDWTLLSSSSEETTQVEGGEEVSATAPAPA